MKIEVRIADFEDAPYIALLGRVTFQETFGHLFPIQTELETYLADTFSVEKIRSSIQKTNNVFWLVVLHTNYRAIQFYEKIGFEKTKQHFFDIGSQHFQFELMVKQL